MSTNHNAKKAHSKKHFNHLYNNRYLTHQNSILFQFIFLLRIIQKESCVD